jgi:hypothetical protein
LFPSCFHSLLIRSRLLQLSIRYTGSAGFAPFLSVLLFSFF